jgi:lysozyme
MTHITRSSINLIKLVEHFECGGNVSKFLKPYLCPAKLSTIGLGNTFYEDGSRVKLSDPAITVNRAYGIFQSALRNTEKQVDSITTDLLTQNQFDALVDFAYNCGIGNLKVSTLLKKVNTNPNDPTIANEFRKWIFGGDGTHNRKDDDGDGLIDEAGEKQKLGGLISRRDAEIFLYFKK